MSVSCTNMLVYSEEKWYLYNHFYIIFVQLSLSYSHYLLILSLPFSLSIVFNQWKERTKGCPKSCTKGVVQISLL